MPDNRDELIKYYTFSERNLAIIGLRRGDSNRLGFAIQLCYMRYYPSVLFGIDENPTVPLLNMVGRQLNVSIDCWIDYGRHKQTRRDHIAEIEALFDFRAFRAPTIVKLFMYWMNLPNKPIKVVNKGEQLHNLQVYLFMVGGDGIIRRKQEQEQQITGIFFEAN